MKLPTTPSFRLDDKTALITGASSGIGLGCAVALAEAGAHVVVSARRIDKLHSVVDAMKAKGLSAEAMVMDVADTNAIKETIDNKGPFDILVNSAGLGRHAPSKDTSLEDFDAVMNVNLRGAYFVTQAVANGLIKAKKPGSLINISSQMGHVGGIDRAVYSASKHAVEGFTKAMAIEWGSHQIRVNTICPTFIRTPLTQSTFDNPDRKEWIESKIKIGRIGEVEDIMGAVVFLASAGSSMVTGSALMVDGGWTAD
ncbi:SDR family oxidoreductase [Candidatus Thioglobus sp.]|uniref:SDR family NAD(P)-dependent oxidoreductase n=1 Tax=unclassified Candidatus Pseudothioglobus TaxID=3072908 RepID=UPI001985783B|nr:SDR family oxidoreductase [Candidatus Thioglobus sp.]MBC8512888.1 SDR family oxidoreductase [Candidatus Pseudothioglobus aerophilus]MDO7562035.1 SDR family oxidoreductase [SAR86 cluster bacterium]MDA8871951.1 SDR family oxidoreductase [Candidatus Thioglobus sp.]MDA8905844.1 SDR family oxidoreductase [Candidatus Thioglobus sp.]MDB4025890.1 SDR family oxidoreductase [Candidatus Thioglobus sp.]